MLSNNIRKMAKVVNSGSYHTINRLLVTANEDLERQKNKIKNLENIKSKLEKFSPEGIYSSSGSEFTELHIYIDSEEKITELADELEEGRIKFDGMQNWEVEEDAKGNHEYMVIYFKHSLI